MSQPSCLFIFIALTIGLLTTVTDIYQRKIYNQHLCLGLGIGLVVTFYTLLINPKIMVAHLTNGSLAFIIGSLLYHCHLWRGGDAKLFALYAFLMPSLGHEIPLFSVAIQLFTCTFIIAMIIIIPIFIKDIILNYGAITNNILARRSAIFQGVVTAIFFSWIIFPIYYIAKITNPVIIVTISYCMFIWGYDKYAENKENYMINFLKKKYIDLCIGIPLGFFIRLWLAPDSLSWPVLIRSILAIGISVTISICIHTAINHLKGYRDRVPFAPLLFLGCVLSYTPFLTWIAQLMRR